MNLLKKIFLISLSISSIAGIVLYANQSYQEYANQRCLENYYSQELEKVYTDGYAVNQDGKLIWSQYHFETAVKDVEKKMLSEGFNRGQIKRMKEEGRSKGQETRRFWEKATRPKKNSEEN